ncbi:MAG: hypothetical protein IMZ65_01380, partial [Planctomycetes bacterium]|nr:hypothetical protein [Planctomycetota bacterium]
MRRFFTIVATAVGVLALTGTLFAQAAQAQKKETAKAPKAMVAMGTIAKYDAATKTLTVTTKKGPENFVIGAETTISEDAKKLAVDDLATLTGQNAKVEYTEAGGVMTATKVTITAAKA